MKFIYKILIVLAVFIGSLIFFSTDITRTLFNASSQTTEFEKPVLPIIKMSVDDNVVNELHGYTSDPDGMCVRECITPLTDKRTFTVLIEDEKNIVKKLKYEIISEDGRELEDGSFTVLENESGPKKVKVELGEPLKNGAEYVAKLTLITGQSKRIYFYTRLKLYDNGHIFEKLDFAQSFHDTLLTGTEEEKEQLKKYLESSKASDNSTFASVNIKSSYNMVTYGDLHPEQVWQQVPTVTEFYENMASVSIKSLLRAEVNGNYEYYVVKEDFRMAFSTRRMYLYDYNRSMESVFDVGNTSLIKNEFKLGITADNEAPTMASDSRKDIAFVYGHELYEYDTKTNILTRVFSYRPDGILEDTDYSRTLYDRYSISLIKLHDSGNIDFLVYGYQNSGEYEGRVGIVLYRFIKAENRIEEQLYIPINTSYSLLKADMTEFSYLNGQDVFYFSLYDTIYSFSLITSELKVIAQNVQSSTMFYCEEEKYVVWQDDPNPAKAKNICVLTLETGNIHRTQAGADEAICLYGRINNNIIYGVSHFSDMAYRPDGSCEIPAYKLVIEAGNGTVLKTYEVKDYYISGIEIGDNILMIRRLTKKLGTDNIYAEAEPDSIMNRREEKTRAVPITKRVTDRVLTEYYVSVPSGVNIESVPELKKAVPTVINHDTTIRVSEPSQKKDLFYAYSFGDVVYAGTSASQTILAADEAVGTVINKNGRLIWERGIKAAKTELSVTGGISTLAGYTSMQAVMRMLLENKSLFAETAGFNIKEQTVCDWLSENMNSTPVNLSGATLDEVLYYVYRGRPVIGVLEGGEACLITGYDAATVTVWQPSKGKSVKLNLKDAQSSFEKEGNIFISYVD